MFRLLFEGIATTYRKALSASRLVVFVTAAAMMLNIGLYTMAPEKVLPIYKTIRGSVHNKPITSDFEVYEIFNKITLMVPRDYVYNMSLTISESLNINAWVDGTGQVTITRSLISFLDHDEGAIAGIIGHEIAHYILGHLDPRVDVQTSAESIQHEIMADYMGIMLSNAAGYNGCNIQMFFKKIQSQYGFSLTASTHPLNATRVSLVSNLCERII